jgi:hypothetical protein
MKTHPHAEAVYEVIALESGAYGVKVSIPDRYPTTVSAFETEDAATAWIESHKSRTEAQSRFGGGFRRPRTTGQPTPEDRH